MAGQMPPTARRFRRWKRLGLAVVQAAGRNRFFERRSEAARWQRELSWENLRVVREHEVVALKLLRRGREVRGRG